MSETNGAVRNLHQKIAAIAGEAQVKVTGHTAPTAGARPALSIADVDRVLGDLMGKHGVTSDFEFLSEPTHYDETTSSGKQLRTYRVHLKSYVVNADAPEQKVERELWDDGSNVSGAVSFALKRYLRALFKLAEDDDTQQAQNRAAQRSDFSQPRAPRPASTSPYDNEETPPPPRPASNGGVSAAQLAARGPLYEMAVKLGKGEVWVDTLLDTPMPDGKTVSVASLKTKLEKEMAKQGQPVPAEEPKQERDPEQLVCPGCGRPADGTDAPREIQGEDGLRWRCLAGPGGCGATYLPESRPSWADWQKWKAGETEQRPADEATASA